MLKFDPHKPLREGDVILVEAKLRYAYDPSPKDGPATEHVCVTIGYSPATVPLDKIHGVASRRFDPGEEVIVEQGKAKVIAYSGEWLWLDLGDGTPASVHADSVSRIDESQPDLLAG